MSAASSGRAVASRRSTIGGRDTRRPSRALEREIRNQSKKNNQYSSGSDMNLERCSKKKEKQKSRLRHLLERGSEKKGKSRLRHLLERGSKKTTKSIVAYTSWREVPKKKSKSLIADTSWREVSKKKKSRLRHLLERGSKHLGRDRKNGILLFGGFFELNF